MPKSVVVEGNYVMDPHEALKLLKEGNKRFAGSNHFFPNLVEEKRLELVKGQNPFAVIISCSDSRVPSEIIFDRGLGDLFVIRNAGNIISSSVVGSVEYALAELDVKLVLILGHDDCGAIKKTIEGDLKSFFIKEITEKIFPAVEQAKKQKGNIYYNAAINNVKNQAKMLRMTGNIIPKLMENNEIMIMGGYYCLSCGEIEFFNIK